MIDQISTAPLPTVSAGIQNHASGLDRTTAPRLLACLAIAGPVFVAVAIIQILTRPGFDLTRQALSLLTLGSWGWVQSANFIISGLLLLAGSVGLRRALQGGPAGRIAPLLLTVCGVGFIGAGFFHPDPSSGFPPGTPAGASAVSSWHGVLHMVCGSLAFLALIILCVVLARRFSRAGQRRWAIGSGLAAAACAIGVITAGAPGGTVSLFAGVSAALLWVSLAAVHMGAGPRRSRAAQAPVVVGV